MNIKYVGINFLQQEINLHTISKYIKIYLTYFIWYVYDNVLITNTKRLFISQGFEVMFNNKWNIWMLRSILHLDRGRTRLLLHEMCKGARSLLTFCIFWFIITPSGLLRLLRLTILSYSEVSLNISKSLIFLLIIFRNKFKLNSKRNR